MYFDLLGPFISSVFVTDYNSEQWSTPSFSVKFSTHTLFLNRRNTSTVIHRSINYLCTVWSENARNTYSCSTKRQIILNKASPNSSVIISRKWYSDDPSHAPLSNDRLEMCIGWIGLYIWFWNAGRKSHYYKVFTSYIYWRNFTAKSFIHWLCRLGHHQTTFSNRSILVNRQMIIANNPRWISGGLGGIRHGVGCPRRF
jgi:hypothetical protein